MPIQFLVRNLMTTESLYRKALKNLIYMEGNALILSTAFINNSPGVIYNSTKTRNEVLIEELAEWINDKNAIFPTKLTIKIVGGYGDAKGNYPGNFILFCSELKSKITDALNFEIIFQQVIGDKWHGKVAIKFEEDDAGVSTNKYYGALVGSSNLTPINVLDSDDIFNWNMETDLFIVDGNRVINSSYHRVKEDVCSIKICEENIEINKKKLSVTIHNIQNKTNFINPIINNNSYSNEDYKKLQVLCKEQLTRDPTTENYLFFGVLMYTSRIINLNRLKEEIIESLKVLRIAGRDLRFKTSKIKEEYFDIYQGSNGILDSTSELSTGKNKDFCTFDDLDKLYDTVKKFENEHIESNKSKSNIKQDIQYFFTSLSEFKQAINSIRKNIMPYKAVYDFKTDGPYIESILKGVYTGINDVIEYFTI